MSAITSALFRFDVTGTDAIIRADMMADFTLPVCLFLLHTVARLYQHCARCLCPRPSCGPEVVSMCLVDCFGTPSALALVYDSYPLFWAGSCQLHTQVV